MKINEYPVIIYKRDRFEEYYPEDSLSDGRILVKDYLGEGNIGIFPDLRKISIPIEGARKLHKKWNKKQERKEKLRKLENLGELVENTKEFQ